MPRSAGLLPALLLSAVAIPAQAAPRTLSLAHAGRLLSADDQPVDGSVTLQFALYRSASAGGDQPAWSGEPVAINVARGYYATTLEVPETAFSVDEPRYLEVRVGSTAMEPRLRLGTVPMASIAANALTVNGLAAAATPQPNALLALDANGRYPATVLPSTVVQADGAGKISAGLLPASVVQADAAGKISAGLLPTGANGVALLDANGRYAAAVLPQGVVQTDSSGKIAQSVLPASVVQTDSSGKIALSALPTGANGLAQLGTDGKLPATVLPPLGATTVPASASADSPAVLGPGDSLTVDSGFNSPLLSVDVWVSLDGGTSYRPLQYAGRVVAVESGDGSDGDLTVSNAQTLDAVRAIATGNAGAQTLGVSSTAGFLAGQRALVVQMQGAGAGAWEEVRITQVGSGTLALAAPLQNSYANGGSNKAQVVKITQLRSLTVQNGGVVQASPWNPSAGTGGVLALKVQNRLEVQVGGRIDASAQGFRGGANVPSPVDYVYGYEGEGELGPGARVGSANGSGGGAGCGQAGGGGGGHGGAGAAGGQSGCYQSCASPTMGVGGNSAPDLSPRVLLGGGGGASGSHGGGGRDGASGGAGGGVVRIQAKELVVRGQILANGQKGVDGYYASAAAQPIGGGGGGGGGLVWLSAESIDLGGATLSAQGGAGGVNNASGGSCSPSGVGGAGAAGRVRLEFGVLSSATATQTPRSEVEQPLGSSLADDVVVSQTLAQPGKVTIKNGSRATLKTFVILRK